MMRSWFARSRTISRAISGNAEKVREDIIHTARGGDQSERTQLADRLDYMLLEALVETEAFALLAMGRTETLGCFCPVNDLLRGAVEALSRSFDTILIDGEAGVEQINRQVVRRVSRPDVAATAAHRYRKRPESAGRIPRTNRSSRDHYAGGWAG